MGTHNSAVDRIAERNMQKWVMAEHVSERLKEKNVENNVGPFVTISREICTQGSEIAALVSQELGWDLLDREIIDYMVDNYGTPRDLVEFVDESRANWIGDVFRTWIERQQFTEAAYAHRLVQLFLLAAQHGKVVIVGRGAQFILPRERGLSVRITAPLEFRIQRLAAERGLSERDARKVVDDSDRQRRDFVQNHFHHDTSNPSSYDVVIDVEKVGTEEAAHVIVVAEQLREAKLEATSVL